MFVLLLGLKGSDQDERAIQIESDWHSAPTGFDSQTNGAVTQQKFQKDKAEFEEAETPKTGLGPVFNGVSCSECHNNPVTGGHSVMEELRVGKFDGVKFVPHPGGSLIQSRAIDSRIQARALSGFPLRGRRISLSVLGDGFIESVNSQAILDVQSKQPETLRGEVVWVTLAESRVQRIGRFGWKSQHASLVSFSADAYVNEMGITSPLQPLERTSAGRDVSGFDNVLDPEDKGGRQGFGKNVEEFASFIRATKAPSRDVALANTPSAIRGSKVFQVLGCTFCHHPEFQTVQAGTKLNGGTFIVPQALGSKKFQPWSDFLLHDVGTGDGIVMNQNQSSANKFRTTPLWGLRTKSRLGHDGRWITRREAIQAHQGEAVNQSFGFSQLPLSSQDDLIVFLLSL